MTVLDLSITNSDNQQKLGVLLMVCAMFLFPISDGVIKSLSAQYPVLLLNWFRFLLGALIFLPVVFVSQVNCRLSSTQLLNLSARAVLHVLAVSLYFLAIARVPLTDALGAYFIAPIIAAVLAAGFLKEKLTRYSVSGIVLGFFGALMVIQPSGSTDIGMIYALGSGVVFGFFLILTRMTAIDLSPYLALAFQCAVGAIILSPVAIIFWVPIDVRDIGIIIGISAIWVGGHLLIILAFRFANTGLLAPLVYLEIIGGAGVGYLLFDYVPDALTVVGIIVIAAAGLLANTRSAITPSQS